MGQRERNWHLSPYTMRRYDWGDHVGGVPTPNSPLPVREIEGATILDEDTGFTYEAVIESANGRAHLVGLTILATRPGLRIDQNAIRRIPVQRIAEQVSLYLAHRGASKMAVFTSGTYAEESSHPTFEDVARDHKDGLSRNAIAVKWHASVYTVDKRLREARDHGLIDPPKTGRPRRNPGPKTGPEAPRAVTTRRKDTK